MNKVTVRLPARAALTLLCACVLFAASPDPARGGGKNAQVQPIRIKSESILFDRDKPRETRFGKLEWLGTLRLTSPSSEFGGYSGLALDRTGTRLLAVSDEGTWLSAEIVTKNGRMEKLTGGRTGKLHGLGNKPLPNKFYQDAESIALQTPGAMTGNAYVSFERKHRIAVYPVTKNGLGPPRRHLKLPAAVRSAQANKGLEGIAVLRGGPSKGALIAFTEEYLDSKGNHMGWLIGGPSPGQVTLKRRDDFSVTDLAGLANGGVIVLERYFRFAEGVKMRLRRVKAGDIRPGAMLDGEVLFETDELREIDNMEGLAVHEDDTGRTILTLVSDDNFNPRFQRTLLMRFAVVE